jgi:hypothetical protein
VEVPEVRENPDAAVELTLATGLWIRGNCVNRSGHLCASSRQTWIIAWEVPLSTHRLRNGWRPTAKREGRGWQGVGLREDARSLYLAMKKESRGVFGESCDVE